MLAATQDDFPHVSSNSQVLDIADRSLSSDEHLAWTQRIGSSPPQVTNLNWLMMPKRATAKQIALRLLPNSEATRWVEMLPLTLLPQHLGRTTTMEPYAKSVLAGAELSAWRNHAESNNMAKTWQAFRHDNSIIQERIVEAVFGTNSPDHLAWRTAAGR